MDEWDPELGIPRSDMRHSDVHSLREGTRGNERLAGLAREFASLSTEDRDFLRVMLSPTAGDVGVRGQNTRESPQTPRDRMGTHQLRDSGPGVQRSDSDFMHQGARMSRTQHYSASGGQEPGIRERHGTSASRDLPQSGQGDRAVVSGILSAPMPPRFSLFYGDPGKSELSYAQWRSEIVSVLDSNLYPEGLVVTHIRRAVRGMAAELLLTMGSDVSVSDILHKFDVRFGDVSSVDKSLERFYCARQLPTESIAAWSCRLEDLLCRVRHPGNNETARGMLRSRFWSGLVDDYVRNAIRHLYDEGSSLDHLIRQARVVEQDRGKIVTQQVSSTCNPTEDKLDMVLKEMKALTSKVLGLESELKSLRSRCDKQWSEGSVPPAESPSSVGHESGGRAPGVPTSTHMSGFRRSGGTQFFRGSCYDCGQHGHKKRDPSCPLSQGTRAPQRQNMSEN